MSRAASRSGVPSAAANGLPVSGPQSATTPSESSKFETASSRRTSSSVGEGFRSAALPAPALAGTGACRSIAARPSVSASSTAGLAWDGRVASPPGTCIRRRRNSSWIAFLAATDPAASYRRVSSFRRASNAPGGNSCAR